MALIKAFWRDAGGATSIEYAVIATLVSLAIIGGASKVGTNLKTLFFQPVAGNLS